MGLARYKVPKEFRILPRSKGEKARAALAEIARQEATAIPAGMWRKLALRAAVECAAADSMRKAREHLDNIRIYAEKSERFKK